MRTEQEIKSVTASYREEIKSLEESFYKSNDFIEKKTFELTIMRYRAAINSLEWVINNEPMGEIVLNAGI